MQELPLSDIVLQRMTGFFKKHKTATAVLLAAAVIWLFWMILFSSFVISRVIQYSVSAFTESDIELTADQAGPLTGFRFRNIRLVSSDGTPLFFAKEFSASWFLPGILAGNAGLSGLVLTDAEIYITQRKDGSWNYEDLTGKAAAEDAPPPSETPESSGFPFPVRFFLKSDIKNLSIFYTSAETRFEIKGISLSADIETERSSVIPSGTDLFSWFSGFRVSLNPDGPVYLSWKTPDSQGEGPLLFSVRTTQTGKDVQSDFTADASSLRILKNNAAPVTSDLLAKASFIYKAETDSLRLDSLTLTETGVTDFKAAGAVEGLFSGQELKLHFDAGNSRLNFDSPGRIAGLFLNDSGLPAAAGTLRLHHLKAEGNPESLALVTDIQGNDLLLNMNGAVHNISALLLKGSGELKLTGENKSPLSFIKNYTIPEFNVIYNNAEIRGNASVTQDAGIAAQLTVNRLRLDPYAAPWLFGELSGKARIGSSPEMNEIRIIGDLAVRNSRYLAFNELSGLNHFFLTTDALIRFTPGTTEIRLNKSDLTARNIRFERSLDLKGDIAVLISDSFRYIFKVPELNLYYNSLHPSLPEPLRLMLAPYREYINDGFRLKTDMEMEYSKTGLLLLSDSTAEIPFLRLDDLRIKTDIFYGRETTEYRKFEAETLRQSLVFRMTGKQGTLPGYTQKGSLLNMSLKLNQPSLFRAHPLIELKGLLDMDLSMNPLEAKGYLKLRDFDLNISNAGCLSAVTQNTCQIWKFKQLNLDLPVNHSYSPAPYKVPPNLLVTQASLPDSVSPPANFSAGYIATSKYPSGQPRKGDFYVIGSPDYPGIRGLTAHADYTNNVIYLNRLKMLMYKESVSETGESRWNPYGYITGTGLYYNLADFNPENQEFGADLQVRKLDLAPWLAGTVAIGREDESGVISFDLTAGASGLHEMISRTRARLSVHEISPRFTGFATRLLVPVAMVAWAANSTLKIPSIQIELKEGLVYSSIAIERGGLLSVLLKPSGEVIRQDRIPLGQFLERAKNEARTLNRSSSSETN